MRSLFDRCSVRVGMSSVPGVSHAHAEAAHSAHAPSRPFPPYNCLVEMELGEGLTGRLLDTHNLLFGDGFSDTLSSRVVGVDGNSAYRPWEADHPGDHRPADHRLHPLAASSAPIQVLTHSPSVAAASSAQMSHYAHTIPTFSDSPPRVMHLTMWGLNTRCRTSCRPSPPSALSVAWAAPRPRRSPPSTRCRHRTPATPWYRRPCRRGRYPPSSNR
ncbi:uncharacterized protein LOC121859111 [Homarus americanus]|uniref:uncharacterized protein LOC121859111 n=1 Tax=Homarus americanus TaxID=6706 RepID=UPI001C477C2E|nr:uncharacterized protein LOC121859111 [Homarus americanus]